MWDYVDKQLKNFDKDYKRINKDTLDEFQNIFNDVKELDKNASKNDLERFKREIQRKYEYLSDYDKYKANKYLKRRQIKYKDILLFSLVMVYAYETFKLASLENVLFKNVSQNTVSKIDLPLKKNINASKLAIEFAKVPNSKGYIWEDYNNAMVDYNAEELYRQVVINLRENKKLDVNSPEFKKIFDRQHKRLINVNGNKTSGALDNEVIGIANQVKLRTYSILGVKKCKFIAVEDKVTTKMCKSLDGQIFNVHDWNVFKRYSAIDDTIKKYKVYGMVVGVNLPPIDNHYHYCRSTITYLLDKNIEKETRKKLTERANKNE